MTPNEKMINNYIFQIGRCVTVKEISNYTNISKSTVFKIIKSFLATGRILCTGKVSGARQFSYNYTYVTKKNEKKVTYMRKEVVQKACKKLKIFTIKDIQKELECSFWQARRHIIYLQRDGLVAPISHHANSYVYEYGKQKESRNVRVLKALKENGSISKKELCVFSGLSESTVKLALKELLNESKVKIIKIINHTKIFGMNND